MAAQDGTSAAGDPARIGAVAGADAPADLAQLRDPELVRAAQTGDEQAFTLLFDRHAPSAWRLALALTGTPDAARRVVTESFARTFTAVRAGRFSPDTTFRSLTLTTVRNTSLDDGRSPGATDAAGRFTYAADDEAQRVAAAFSPLPERWRTVLWLANIEGFRASKVAPIVGLAPAATRALGERARTGLREQYLRLDLDDTVERSCTRAVSRLGAHVDGSLNEADTALLERHLRLCPTCSDRRDRLADLGPRLRLLVLPLPADLVDDARAAWSAVVVAPASRTGLSPTVEKVLAGVSAFAAAVGVLGATLFGVTGGNGGDALAAPAAPSAVESAAPAPVAPAPDASIGRSDSAGGTDRDGFGSSARRGTAGSARTGAANGDGVVGASSPSRQSTPAGGLGDRDGRPRTDRTRDSNADNPAATSPEPAVRVGTTIADLPIAVDVGEVPGVTFGPVSGGSKPAPAEDSTVSVGGPLAPLAPVVEPIDAAVSGVAPAAAPAATPPSGV